MMVVLSLEAGTWLLIACAAWAQQSTVSTKNYDINGHPVAGVSSVQVQRIPFGGHSRRERPYRAGRNRR